MNSFNRDHVFSGSIAQLYDQYLVPLIFDAYAKDLTSRLAALKPLHVLEIAAGTGAVTRHLATQLPADTSIVATDLNQPMLDHAKNIGTSRAVTWQQADAMHLPFEDGAFDAAVCQFGVMFFPDRAAAFAETRRVLRPGGTFLFNVWDRLADNEFADCVTQAMGELFSDDPPKFFARVPHGYYEEATIADDLLRGGFAPRVQFDTITMRSTAESALLVATALCQGTPLRNEIEARGTVSLSKATELASAALARRFGANAVSAKMQAIVVSATLPDE